MELRVHLKICEACGCFWFRAQVETGVYCSTCQERLKDFPTPRVRVRPGRPKKTTLPAVFAVEAAHSSHFEDAFPTDTEFEPIAEITVGQTAIGLLAAEASRGCLTPCTAGAL